MGPDGEWQLPKPPTRRFPADTDPVGVIPGHARVDLIFERSRLLRGSVGGQPVRLDLNVPARDGAAAGTIAGIPASATWKNGDNYYIYPDVPSDLTGSFAGQPVELHARFHLEPGDLAGAAQSAQQKFRWTRAMKDTFPAAIRDPEGFAGYAGKLKEQARTATRALIDQVVFRSDWRIERVTMYRAGDLVVKFAQASGFYVIHLLKPGPDDWADLSDDDFPAPLGRTSAFSISCSERSGTNARR